MNTSVREVAWRLIDDYQLHTGELPVDLSPLESIYVPKYRDLRGTGLRGFARPQKRGTNNKPVPTVVVVHSIMNLPERRLYYVHEVAHLALGHPGGLHALAVDDWFHDRYEREAWEVAAILLVPSAAFEISEDIAEAAARCLVPLWLAEMGTGQYGRRPSLFLPQEVLR